MTGRQLICFVMSTLGLALIVNVFEASPEAADSLGIFYGLLAAVIISYFLLHETMTVSQAVGGAMILGFALWNEWKSSD